VRCKATSLLASLRSQEWETLAADEKVYRPFPPSPKAIDRMLETCAGCSGWRSSSATWSGCGPSATAGETSHPLCLRPHDGVAALAEALQTVADQLNGMPSRRELAKFGNLLIG
jgi:hypothetical protein